MDKDYSFTFDEKNTIENFKIFIKKYNCRFVTVDLGLLDAFEALKYAVLASVYHFQEYPSGKLSFKNYSPDINSLILDFSMDNMEFV